MKRNLFLAFAMLLGFGLSAQTISEIQGQADASPYADLTVTTTGVVSGIRYSLTDQTISGYFLQDGPGAWNGVYVYDNTNQGLAVGDNVTIDATVVEYFTMTEIKTVTALTKNSSGNAISPTVITSTEINDEAYEGVFVRIDDVTCSEAIVSNGIWTASDANGTFRVDDWLFHFEPTVGQEFSRLIGCVVYDWNERKLCPRNEDDVTFVTTVAANMSVYPNPVSSSMTISSDEMISSVEVVNVIGQTVASQSVNAKQTTVNTSALNSGVYFVKIQNNAGNTAVSRIVKN